MAEGSSFNWAGLPTISRAISDTCGRAATGRALLRLPMGRGIAPGVRIYEEHSIGIYDCYTFPAFRSRGIYTDSLIRMLRQIRHEGVSRSLIAALARASP